MSKLTITLPTVVFETKTPRDKISALDFVAFAFTKDKKTVFAVCFDAKNIEDVEIKAKHCATFLFMSGIEVTPTDISMEGAEFNIADGKQDHHRPPHLQHQTWN